MSQQIKRRVRVLGAAWSSAAILSLALLVGFFGLEAAIHSVHHLSDPGQALCPIFSASQHVVGVCDQVADAGAPTATLSAGLAVDAERTPPLPRFPCFEGRAPPVTPSA